MKKVSVIIADSSDLIRIGLRVVLSKDTDLEIIGEAKNEPELLDMAKNFSPNIVLIDYTSQDFSIDIIPKVLNENKKINFVAITPDQSAQTVVDALRSGVKSHIKKDCSYSEILDSVVQTSKGTQFFCGKILETIQKADINIDELHLDGFNCEPVLLSERELEIIKYIAEGYTNVQIANHLILSNHTINTHRKNIMNKLGVKNTAGIVMYAVKMNLVSPNKFLFAEKQN